MYRIRVYATYVSSEESKSRFESVFETHLNPNYGPDKKYYITLNDNDYTHVVILNTAMPVIRANIPRENVIGFAWEPRPFLGLTMQFIEYAMKNIGNYYIGDVSGLPYPFVLGNTYMWHNPPPPRPIKLKRNTMSIMVSFKSMAPGHVYRHVLVEEILKQRLPVDIYGNGCKRYSLTMDPRVKGPFELNEPYESYKFHIAIENFTTVEYFSEKIINTLLHNTVPLYLGAQNIDKYFKNMYIRLFGDPKKDIEVIKDVLRNPNDYYQKHLKNSTQVEEDMNFFKNGNLERAFSL